MAAGSRCGSSRRGARRAEAGGLAEATRRNSRVRAWRSAARSSTRRRCAQALVEALEAELLDTYDGVPGSGGLPSASIFEPPDGAFFVGRIDGEAVACGGIARYDEATAEIRRMYVAPGSRGRGLSRRVLTTLEDEARRSAIPSSASRPGSSSPRPSACTSPLVSGRSRATGRSWTIRRASASRSG